MSEKVEKQKSELQIPVFFHPLDGLTQEEKIADNVREFVGNGTPYLEVPGLKKVQSVRVGTMDIPLTFEQEFPVDPSGNRLQSVSAPLIALKRTPNGKQVLLRGIQSNNGIWQDGEKIYVQGDWEAEKPAGSPPNDK